MNKLTKSSMNNALACVTGDRQNVQYYIVNGNVKVVQ